VVTGPAGRGTLVRVDPVRFIASEGSVSVIELAPSPKAAGTAAPPMEIPTGLHASAMALSPTAAGWSSPMPGSDTAQCDWTRGATG